VGERLCSDEFVPREATEHEYNHAQVCEDVRQIFFEGMPLEWEPSFPLPKKYAKNYMLKREPNAVVSEHIKQYKAMQGAECKRQKEEEEREVCRKRKIQQEAKEMKAAADLRAALPRMRREVDEITRQIDALTAEREKLLAAIKEATESIDRVSHLEQDLALSREQAQRLQDENDTLRAEVAELHQIKARASLEQELLKKELLTSYGSHPISRLFKIGEYLSKKEYVYTLTGMTSDSLQLYMDVVMSEETFANVRLPSSAKRMNKRKRKSVSRTDGSSSTHADTSFRPRAHHSRSWSRYDAFGLFCMRHRLGIKVPVISMLTGFKTTMIYGVIELWIEMAHVILTSINFFPKKEAYHASLREGALGEYEEEQVYIGDGTNIPLVTPDRLDMNNVLYNRYYNSCCGRVVVVCSPHGLFTAVSDVWAGSTSEDTISEKDALHLRLAKGGATVYMFDKGLEGPCAALFELQGIRVVRPVRKHPRRYGFHFTSIIYNKNVSKLRIHVERGIATLKQWSFFHRAHRTNELAKIGKICQVIALTSNFGSTFMSKFLAENWSAIRVAFEGKTFEELFPS